MTATLHPTAQPPRKPFWTAARMLKAVLFVQFGFAAVLFGGDLIRVLPQLFNPSNAPALTDPFRPGDQTRRYDPARVPTREASPGSRPLPSNGDMPSRLLFEETTWQDQRALLLTGEIAAGDADRFAEHIATTEDPQIIFLNSPGGSVSDALAIGRQVRSIEAATAMADSDVCLSACPYILAAGMSRTIPEGAWVGVHQHFFGKNIALPAFLAVEDIQRGQGDVMGYLNDMGIDPLVMQHALITPPNEIYLLTQDELIAYNFLPTAAE